MPTSDGPTGSLLIDAEPSPPMPAWMRILLITFVAVVLLGAGLFVAVARTALQVTQQIQSPIDVVLQLGDSLETDAQGRTNILLFGSGGKQWDEGTDLTDTIMVASVDEPAKRVTLISIPRDLYVDIPGYGMSRLNYLWPYGVKTNATGEPIPALPKQVIQEITGLEIQYVAKVDFRAFQMVIDEIGGVDVTVERAFTDKLYPTEDYKYRTVSFEEGLQHLDGKRALEFVRSRHAEGVEGSDFARARRQQLVIQALRTKFMDTNLLDDKERLQSLMTLVNEHYVTDLTLAEDLTLAKIAKQVPRDNILSYVLSDGPRGLLYEPDPEERMARFGGAFVLVPIDPTYETIHRTIQRFLADPELLRDPPTVIVLNGTNVVGAAKSIGELLNTRRFDILETANATKRDYPVTLVIDRTGEHGKHAQRIADLVRGQVAVLPLEEQVEQQSDLLVIVGFSSTPGGAPSSTPSSAPAPSQPQ